MMRNLSKHSRKRGHDSGPRILQKSWGKGGFTRGPSGDAVIRKQSSRDWNTAVWVRAWDQALVNRHRATITSTAAHKWMERAAYGMLGVRDSNPIHSYSLKKLEQSKHFQVWLFFHCPTPSLRKAEDSRPAEQNLCRLLLEMHLNNKQKAPEVKLPHRNWEKANERQSSQGGNSHGTWRIGM